MSSTQLEFLVRVKHTTKADRFTHYEALVTVLADTETEAHLCAAQMVSATRHGLGGTVIGTTTEGITA